LEGREGLVAGWASMVFRLAMDFYGLRFRNARIRS
jgi:hypothetical protein